MTTRPINLSMTSVQWAMLICLSLLWGGSFFFVGVLVQEVPTVTIVFFRVFIAACALHLFMRATGRHMPWTKSAWISFFALGLLNNVLPFSFIVWGQSHIASGVASILNATTPLFTVLVAHMLTSDEKLSPLRVGGIIVGFLGVAVMIGGGAIADGLIVALAMLSCLSAAMCYAFAAVFGRRFTDLDVNPIGIATGQVTASAVIMFPVMLILDRPWTLDIPSTQSVVSLIALALVSTAFAYILFFRILSGAGATNASLVTFLVPVSAIFLGIFFLGEALLPRHMAGLALIALGLSLVDGRLFKRRRLEG